MAYIASFIHAVMMGAHIRYICQCSSVASCTGGSDRHNVDRALRGDVVGYYPFPNETIDIMVKRRAISIQGNHDRAVLNVDPSMMNPEASDAVMWTASQLSDRSRRYLASLPPNTAVRSGKEFIRVFHGSPRDPIEYVYEDDVTEGLLLMARCSMLVMGHTHIPYVRRFPSGLIVNPGRSANQGTATPGQAIPSWTPRRGWWRTTGWSMTWMRWPAVSRVRASPAGYWIASIMASEGKDYSSTLVH